MRVGIQILFCLLIYGFCLVCFCQQEREFFVNFNIYGGIVRVSGDFEDVVIWFLRIGFVIVQFFFFQGILIKGYMFEVFVIVIVFVLMCIQVYFQYVGFFSRLVVELIFVIFVFIYEVLVLIILGVVITVFYFSMFFFFG